MSVLISPVSFFFFPLDLQADFTVDEKAMVGETEVKERPKSNPDYLMQLMNDRKVMSSLPNFSGIFTHLERLLDEGNSQETLNHRQKSSRRLLWAQTLIKLSIFGLILLNSHQITVGILP